MANGLPAALEIRLFGEPSIRYMGRVQPLAGPPRTVPLLVYLLLFREGDVRREIAASRLWPDAAEPEALANLRRHLHYLRQTLPALESGGTWIRTSRKFLRWDPPVPYTLDVAVFEALSVSGTDRERAVTEYRGPLFERCDDEWLLYERDRLAAMQISNLSWLMQQAREAGDFTNAKLRAAQLLAIDPWREDVLRALMEAHVQAGDRAGALVLYENLRVRLDDELGVPPAPETMALVERIALGGGPPVRFAERDGSEPVGRSNEMETLQRSWRNAFHGHVAVALIGGEAGSGKTTLARAIADVVEKDGGTVLWGAARREGGAAFAEIGDILRSSLHAWEPHIAERPRSLLARIVPDLGLPATGDEPANIDQTQLFAAVGDAMEITARGGPLLVCLEDMHWAGESSMLLLEYLARRLVHARVLLLATYREEDVSAGHPLRRFRRRFTGSAFLTNVPLAPLQPDDVLVLAEKAVGAERARTIAPAVYRESGGNALLAHELLASAGEPGGDRVAGGARGLIDERVAQLDGDAQTVARAAAILEHPLSPELIGEITGLPEAAVASALNTLCAKRIVRIAAPYEHAEYAFSHQLFARAVAEAVPAANRRALHRRVALLFEAMDGDDEPQVGAAAIAYHAEAGGLDSAASWYVRAARHAFDTFANAEAAEFIGRALALSQGDVRYDALMLAEAIADREGERARQQALLDEALALVGPDGERGWHIRHRRFVLAAARDDVAGMQTLLAGLERDAPGRMPFSARAAWDRGVLLRYHAREEEALAVLGRAFDAFNANGDANEAAEVASAIFAILSTRNTFDTDDLARMEAIAERAGPVARVRLYHAQAQYALQHDARAALEKAVAMERLAVETGERRLEGLALLYQGCALTWANDTEGARRALHVASDVLSRCGTIEDEVRVLLWKGIVEGSVGNYRRCAEINRAAIPLAVTGNLPHLLFHLYVNLGCALKDLDEQDEARRRLLEAIAIARRHGMTGFIANPLTNLGVLELQRHRYRDAIGFLREALAEPRMGTLQAPMIEVTLGLCHLGLGEVEAAERFADVGLAWLAESPAGASPREVDVAWDLARLVHALPRRAHAAGAALARAGELYRATLAGLVDTESREAFVADHGPLRAALERDEWASEPAGV